MPRDCLSLVKGQPMVGDYPRGEKWTRVRFGPRHSSWAQGFGAYKGWKKAKNDRKLGKYGSEQMKVRKKR